MPAANDDDVGDKMSGVARKMVCAARVWSCAADFDDVAEAATSNRQGRNSRCRVTVAMSVGDRSIK